MHYKVFFSFGYQFHVLIVDARFHFKLHFVDILLPDVIRAHKDLSFDYVCRWYCPIICGRIEHSHSKVDLVFKHVELLIVWNSDLQDF